MRSAQLGSTGVQISRLALGGVNYHRLPDAEAARVVHQLHDLKHEDELRTMAGAGGALKAVERFRDAGTIRFVGITGHWDPSLLVRALDVHPFGTILCALGAMHEAVRPFHAAVVPIARARGVGVLGMKVYAYGMLKEYAVDALRFVLGLDGVDAAVVGIDSIEQLEANVRAARAFTPLSSAARQALPDRAARIHAARPADAWFIKLPGDGHPDGGAG